MRGRKSVGALIYSAGVLIRRLQCVKEPPHFQSRREGLASHFFVLRKKKLKEKRGSFNLTKKSNLANFQNLFPFKLIQKLFKNKIKI